MLGSKDEWTLSSLGVLASLLRRREKYDEAEALYREALDGIREVLGEKDPWTLTTLNNLCVLLQEAFVIPWFGRSVFSRLIRFV